MKTRNVVISPEARDDLLRLYDRLAEVAGTSVALGYIDRLEAYCQSFRNASERGRARNDIRPGLRIVGFEKRVSIAFTVEEERVVILRLFYGGRNWETILAGQE
ncbi:type II toxin-antitoxin system RelE/ParE family toxin [Hwanghaeella grinnelliae]|uniref:Type II toxin-antitoxin system RelE/ParE family toxin n=1 Tax=Hwanghaeella grinnelliae TaxID=2500179 RepID=A0A437QQK9_9PROT|nr:type II toxin-antitoxin system RelE/ParE family toxin [Hwanghaeella grinnelliae]RVU36794.1 type II toxin-antitoxin system RelE/ParE family toxin [Hwanghaeella grinnelliae]